MLSTTVRSAALNAAAAVRLAAPPRRGCATAASRRFNDVVKKEARAAEAHARALSALTTYVCSPTGAGADLCSLLCAGNADGARRVANLGAPLTSATRHAAIDGGCVDAIAWIHGERVNGARFGESDLQYALKTGAAPNVVFCLTNLLGVAVDSPRFVADVVRHDALPVLTSIDPSALRNDVVARAAEGTGGMCARLVRASSATST